MSIPWGRLGPLGWAVPVVLVASGLGLLVWYRAYLDSFNLPQPLIRPMEGQALAEARERPDRVMVLVIDGLRLDHSRAMANLEGLRARGWSAMIQAPWPSFTRPVAITLGTGVPPLLSGVRLNGQTGATGLDSIFASLVRAGGTAAMVGDGVPWWAEVYSPFIAEAAFGPPPLDGALVRAIKKGHRLVVAHTLGVDKAGHEGGTGQGYAKACLEADRLVGLAMGRMDLKREALVVVSDHGHRDRGGHGGPEAEVVVVPWVMVGRGVRPGVSGVWSACSFAPTLALLLGVRPPGQAMAMPALEALASPPPVAPWREHTRRALSRGLMALGQGSEGGLEELARRMDRVLGGQGPSPWRAIGLLLLASLALGLMMRSWPGRLAMAGLVPLQTVLFVALYRLGGGAFTFSAIGEHDAMVREVAVAGLGASLIHLAAASAALCAQARGNWGELASRYILLAWLAALLPWALALQGKAPFPSAQMAFLPLLLGGGAGTFLPLALLWWGLVQTLARREGLPMVQGNDQC